MGKLTDIGRVQRCIDFKKNRGSIWVGLGRTSEWPDEQNPPAELTETLTIEELTAMKLFSEATIVVPVEMGPIYFKGSYYKKLSDKEALAQGISNLYLRFELLPQEFPKLINYRQIGVFVDSVPKEGYLNYSSLAPTLFDNLGKLVYFSNEKAQNRYTKTRHVIEVVIPG